MNCTFTIRRPGHVAYNEGLTSMASAAQDRDDANRTVQPGHQVYAVWGSGEVTLVSEDDIEEMRSFER